MNSKAESGRLLVVLGNQLFPIPHLEPARDAVVFMAEDLGLCTYERHHQQKIVLFLAAMRSYRDALLEAGFDVRYHTLEGSAEGIPEEDYEHRLDRSVRGLGCNEIVHFEIEDKPMEAHIVAFAEERGLRRTEIDSPMFVCDRQTFDDFVSSAERPLMAEFYKQQRRRLHILVDHDGKPTGGRWSFDADNRKKLPADVAPPKVTPAKPGSHVDDVIELVRRHFSDHPGDAAEFWWPSTRAQALAWVDEFLAQRFATFGPYEDAITQRSATVFHSVSSACLNLGLVTPDELVERALEYARSNEVPIQSLEGFVRQIIGWREFIRGIYRHFSEDQESRNFWGHERELTEDWYTATTGIPPLDDAIETAQRLGWTHHIPRLMVIANLMTLAEIRPSSAHRWFMEMFVDSSEWVMGPNVYGMGLFSDGGIFATKPYICGSNYLLKMSDYRKGPWCDVVDGLYWRFIGKHRSFFEQQPRLALMPKALDRLTDERKQRIFAAADTFLKRHTR